MIITNFDLFHVNGRVLEHQMWVSIDLRAPAWKGDPLLYSHHFHTRKIAYCACWRHELLPGKEILYFIHITSILEKLPTMCAGDTGTIPCRYRGTNRLNRNNSRADSAPGSENGSPCIS